MTSQGIYTLANDPVYDQLIALLNSIQKNVSPDIPICVIPYDHRLEKVKQEINSRPNVTLFDNQEALTKWDDFINHLWNSHNQAKKSRFSRPAWYKGFVHRKFASFDGNFDKFIFFDADSLAMKSLDDVFQKLDNYDLVFNDWEHNKKKESTELDLDLIQKNTKMTEIEIRPRLHCDSFFASHKGLFDVNKFDILQENLVKHEQIEWVKSRCWWSSSALFSCMTFKPKYQMFNFTLSENPQNRTGNCADADPFVNIDNVLYNEQGLKPIHRIHYMNYSSAGFSRLCQGEDVDIRYRDIFLYYRFLQEPDKKPQTFVPPTSLEKIKRKYQGYWNKIKRVMR